MVDSIASGIHRSAIWEVPHRVHELGTGKRGSSNVLVRADRLRVVDGVARFVKRGAIRQVAHVVGELKVRIGILLEGIGRILHGHLGPQLTCHPQSLLV